MRTYFVLAGISAALAGQAHAAESQFNLECTGTRTKLGVNEVKPFSMSYRIDLDGNVFCFATCTSTESIKEVTPLNITLKDEVGRFGSSKIVLDRAKGQLSMSSTIEMLPGRKEYYRIEAACTPKPFSGFPATKF